MTVSVLAHAQFINNAVGATGLTVTVDVDRHTRSDGTRTMLVTAGAATEGRNGMYWYLLTGADLTLYDYVVMFKTAGTADQKQIASLWSSYSLDNTAAIAAIPTTAPDNASITAIKAKTDNLPASPAATGDIPTANITAIKAKTDNLPASPAATSDIPTAVQIDTRLSGAHGAGLWTGAAGTGPIQWTYTLTNSIDSLPVPQAYVWVTTDAAGANIMA